MFFIFGLHGSFDLAGVVTRVCRNCGNQVAQVINRRSTKCTLFFIPLISVRTRHTQQCTSCRAEFDVSGAESELLAVG